MAFKASFAKLFIFATACKVAAGLSQASNHTRRAPTVVDKIMINGNLQSEGTGIPLGTCQHAPKEATSFTVCGCNVKVFASLLTECQEYGKYTQQVGHCNCGESACDTKELLSGYTEKFSWTAVSYEVKSCK